MGIVDRGSGIGEGIVGTQPAVSACGVGRLACETITAAAGGELLLRQLGCGVSLSVIVPMGCVDVLVSYRIIFSLLVVPSV